MTLALRPPTRRRATTRRVVRRRTVAHGSRLTTTGRLRRIEQRADDRGRRAGEARR